MLQKPKGGYTHHGYMVYIVCAFNRKCLQNNVLYPLVVKCHSYNIILCIDLLEKGFFKLIDRIKNTLFVIEIMGVNDELASATDLIGAQLLLGPT